MGLSGGLDSSWTLVKVVELGLRPLAVHMDNGWNSELAQNNIFNLVDKLDVDLYTHVIEWHEYRNLMQSFFDADVLDVELLYDNAMIAVNYNQAKSNNIKYILAGTNVVTEGMKMPNNWSWLKYDKKNMKNIGYLNNVKLKTFPSIGVIERIYYEKIRNIKWISFLDFISYERENAIKEVAQKAILKKTGARGLRSILENILLKTMFDLPGQENIEEIIVDLGAAKGQNDPILIHSNVGKVKPEKTSAA